jgi:hypothetical protein
MRVLPGRAAVESAALRANGTPARRRRSASAASASATTRAVGASRSRCRLPIEMADPRRLLERPRTRDEHVLGAAVTT